MSSNFRDIIKEKEFRELLKEKRLHVVFQPIVDLTVPAVIGHEALIRGPKDSEFHSPKALFEMANEQNLLVSLEFLCIEIACKSFMKKNLPGRLFLNISPISLTNSDVEKHIAEFLLDEIRISPEQVVIELSEQHPYDDYELIGEALKHLKLCGFEIALDDLGAGYSSLRLWSEFKPQFVKIDMHFIQNIHIDKVKYEFVRSIQDISRSLGTSVVAEGIETEKELRSLCGLGISHGQGYLLGKPSKETFVDLPAEIKSFINPLRQFNFIRHQETLVSYVEQLKPLDIELTLEDASNLLEKRVHEYSLPIVNTNSVPIGILTRQVIYEVFFSRYGRELNSKKKIAKYVDDRVLIVDINQSLAEVSTQYTARSDLDMNSNIIVTENGKYIGVLRTKKLLAKITEQKILSARYANPLSMLPGNVPIYEWIDYLLKRQTLFKVAYFDINFFKPYNDTYGYTYGDRVIVMLSNLLKQCVNAEIDRLGHIGGDDFIVIFQSGDWEKRCYEVLREFAEKVKHYYTDEDLKKGGIESYDRRGEKDFFPLLSLSVGIVEPDPGLCQSHHDVARLATDAKKEAKRIGSNNVFLSRRKGNDTSLFQDEQINRDDNVVKLYQ